jgi:hypothetical protein
MDVRITNRAALRIHTRSVNHDLQDSYRLFPRPTVSVSFGHCL